MFSCEILSICTSPSETSHNQKAGMGDGDEDETEAGDICQTQKKRYEINCILLGLSLYIFQMLHIAKRQKRQYKDCPPAPRWLTGSLYTVEEIEKLIAQGVNLNNPDEWGFAPLHTCRNAAGRVLLIKAGADVNSKDVKGKTPLLKETTLKVTKALLAAKADVDAQDAFHNTALHQLLSAKHCMLLLRARANPNVVNAWGDTPLFNARGKKDIESCRLLLHAKADIDATAKDGLRAVFCVDSVIQEFLLSQGATPYTDCGVLLNSSTAYKYYYEKVLSQIPMIMPLKIIILQYLYYNS
jgi:hypothetical protein